ncbi:MAG: segregation/condensation protein A [Anaerolineales bacterium]|nr:segregation/condensation protein A [Anaerolineales bacterium]
MLATSAYTVQLNVYEGPLDLLLDLIERAELDITKVSLAMVTDQYLAYLHDARDRHLEDLASFLVVAARLLQIKSEALLPRPPERELDEDDPGDALARQLILYKKFKNSAQFLNVRQQQGMRSFLRLAAPPTVEAKLDLTGVSIKDLVSAFTIVMSTRHDHDGMQRAISGPHIRVRDRIVHILDMLHELGRVTFKQIVKTARTRVEIVVSFLAMLELVKQSRIEAQQDSLFGEIQIIPGQEWQDDQSLEFELEFEE